MPPARCLSGEILFTDRHQRCIDLLKQSPEQMQKIRGNEIAMIFQEPMTSFKSRLYLRRPTDRGDKGAIAGYLRRGQTKSYRALLKK